MLGIGLAVAACVAGGLLIIARRRRRRLAQPAEYDWSVVGRGGVTASFSCGHERPRTTDYRLRSSAGVLYYRRSVPRHDADAVPCGDCLCQTLKITTPIEAVRAHALRLHRVMPTS